MTRDWAGRSARAKPDFVGKRSLARPAMSAPQRRQLVGLLTRDPQVVLEEGAQLMGEAGARVPTRPLGHVTSSYLSATLGRSIAMGLLAGGRARMGETLYVVTARGEVAVEVTASVFYDPSGARIHG